jgi:hypothetical protein
MREWLRRAVGKRASSNGAGGRGGGNQHRQKNLSILLQAGFCVANALPLIRDERGSLRPISEIASRLRALDVLFGWVAYPEERCPSDLLRTYAKTIDAEAWLTEEEHSILGLARGEAQQQHGHNIGWKLENMWPLAWVLGFPTEPPFDGQWIPDEVTRQVQEYAMRINPKKLTARSYEDVDALEDLFYCAHNAVGSAQIGAKTVPDGFDPIANGGVICERRRALTWCLSPGVDWNDTDLST